MTEKTRVLAGAVLAGGKSLRFGRNKALERLEGEKLVDRSVRLLKYWCDPVFVVGSNLLEYIGIEAVLLSDFKPHKGPLMGLYTVMSFSPKEWIFVRAVDMPFLSEGLVKLLIEEMSERVDAIVPVKEGKEEPLCSLYNVRCLSHIAMTLNRGKDRIVHFFDKIRVKYIGEEKWRRVDPEGISFININTLDEWQRIIGGSS